MVRVVGGGSCIESRIVLRRFISLLSNIKWISSVISLLHQHKLLGSRGQNQTFNSLALCQGIPHPSRVSPKFTTL